MSFINWFKSLGQVSRGLFEMNVPKQAAYPKLSYEQLVQMYRGWVYICASRNATSVASVPMRLYATVDKGEQMPRTRSGHPGRVLTSFEKTVLIDDLTRRKRISQRILRAEDIVEIFDHPFLDLINQPNQFRSGFEFFEETSIFLDLTGDAYWQVTMNKQLGIPQSLFILPSQYVKIVPSKTQFIEKYLYGRGIEKIPFTDAEVVHFRVPNPNDQLYGMGCLEGGIVAVTNYEAMDAYEKALNQNMAVPGTLVSYKGKVDKKDIKALEADWNKAMKGIRNSGKVKVASQEFDVKEVGFSPREMGFLQGRKWSRLEIADAFDVPVSLLDTENVNKANAQAGNEQYARTAIQPRLQRIEDRINDDIIPLYEEPRIFAAFDNPVPEDQVFMNESANTAFRNNLITRNEGRKMIGLAAGPDGNIYFYQLQPGAPEVVNEAGQEIESGQE